MMKERCRYLLPAALALGLIAAATTSAVNAQSFPSKMIRILVPGAPGTPPDIMARIIASELGESQGWRVIVENKPGAIQTIGLMEVLKQPADGYTIASVAMSASAAHALLPEVRFRLDRDFAPVIKLAGLSWALCVAGCLALVVDGKLGHTFAFTRPKNRMPNTT